MDLLAKAAKTSTKKPTKKKAAKDRLTFVLEKSQLEDDFTDLCELSFIAKEVESPLASAKKESKSGFFDLWLDRFWEKKELPQNPDVVITRKDGKHDMKAQFQVRENKKSFEKVLPPLEDMGDPSDEGYQTCEQILIEVLEADIGLSSENAKAFVQDEVVINERITLKHSFDEMYYGDDEDLVKISTKLLEFFGKRNAKSRGTVDLLNDKEMEAVGGSLLQTTQQVALRENYFQRMAKYCRTKDELKSLVERTCIFALGKFKFCVSDTPQEKSARVKAIIKKHLAV